MVGKQSSRAARFGVLFLLVILVPVACAADPDTQLMDGIRAASIDDVRSAISRGADVNKWVEVGFSSGGGTIYAPIISYAIRSHVPVPILETLHNAGANINAPDLNGKTPLFYAVTTREDLAVWRLVHGDLAQYPAPRSDAAEWLLSTAEDPSALANQKDDRGSTVLHVASIGCDTALVTRLLDLNINIDPRDNDGVTPLMGASLYGCIDVVNLLLASGARLSLRDLDGREAIIYAARRGDISIIRAVVSAGSSVSPIDKSGVSALMYAAHAGSREVIDYLLSLGADSQRRDSQGRTALMWACMEPESIGAPPGLIRVGGHSEEVKQQHSEAVLALIEAGIDLSARNSSGRTAFEYAQDSGVLDGTDAFWRLSDARF